MLIHASADTMDFSSHNQMESQTPDTAQLFSGQALNHTTPARAAARWPSSINVATGIR